MFPTLKRHQTTTKHQYTSRGVVASPTIQVTALIDTKTEIIGVNKSLTVIPY